MSGLASRVLDAALEDGDMRGPLGGMFPADLPVPSFADALAPLSDKLPKVEPSKGQLAKMAWKKAGSIQAQFPSLTRDECAAVVLYTMEDMPRERSPYYVMNAALREKNRQAVRPWRDFVWLLLHALRKLPPSKARVVYRGMAGSVLEEGDELQWSAFSSTATKVDVMEVFLDTEETTSGARTMIHLELTEPVGRDVSTFSLYPQECEVLLPPNVCFEVVSRYNAGSGLVMVQCKQTESLDSLLDFGRRGDVPLGQPIDEVPMGLPADADEALQAKPIPLRKAVIAQLNKARIEPKQYADVLEETLADAYKGKHLACPTSWGLKKTVTAEGAGALRGLLVELRATRRDHLPRMRLVAALDDAAQQAAEELAAGKSPTDLTTRLSSRGIWSGSAGEACVYGVRKAEAIVGQLLLSDGDKKRLNRRFLMNEDLRVAGFGMAEHPKHGYVCLIVCASVFATPIDKPMTVECQGEASDDFMRVLNGIPSIQAIDIAIDGLELGKKVKLKFVPPGSIDITVYEKDGSARTSSLKWA